MRDIINTKILLSLATLIVALVVVVGATYAFFSDTETSADNTFVSGAVDLKIDNESFYNGIANPDTSWASTDLTNEKFFDFQDVKPSDYGEDTISVKVETNDAWVCADVTLTSNDENSLTANEIEDGDTGSASGELANRINFIWWADDGDNVLETGENVLPGGPIGALDVDETATVSLADSQSSIFPTPSLAANGAMVGNQTYHVGKAWCFGAITPAPLSPSDYPGPDANNDGIGNPGTPADGGYACDSSNENDITQTDSLTADISFRAFQSRNNPTFTCKGNETTPTPTLTPTPTPVIACTSTDNIFASEVIASTQGLRKNGTPVTADRDDPLDATGLPQHPLALDFDSPVVADSFFSLGFPHANNSNVPGSIELDMGEVFYPNPSGDDLFIYEVTGGTSYPIETAQVYAKLNLGDSWSLLGTVSRDEGVELSGGSLTSARYVRLVEASAIGPFEATADGFDLDAIKAFCTQVSQ